MTRKDYEAIAAAIRSTVIDGEHGIVTPDRELVAIAAVAGRIAAALASDNPAFDRARFLKACGL
jgi:hypothetical protein